MNGIFVSKKKKKLEQTKHKQKKTDYSRIVAQIINGVGFGIFIWMILFPKPNKYIIITAILYPIISICIVKYFRGQIKISKEKHKDDPTIIFGLLGSIIVLGFRAMADFNILDYSKIWIPVLIISSICIAIVLFKNQEFQSDKASRPLTIFTLIILALVYSYGSYILLNCVLDESKPEVYTSIILSKNSSKNNKPSGYYFELAPWGKQIKPVKISVFESFYDSYDVNDELKILQMKGKFNILWFKVTDKNVSK